MKIRTLSKREKSFLYVAWALLSLILIFKFLITPTIGRISKMNNDIDAKAALLKRHFLLVRKGESILSYYEDNSTDISSEELVASLFKEIEVSAKKFNLIIEKIKPQPIEKKEGYKEVSLEVELIGDFAPIFQFINHLENLPSFIKVSALRLLPQSRGSSRLRCRIRLAKLFF